MKGYVITALVSLVAGGILTELARVKGPAFVQGLWSKLEDKIRGLFR